MQDWLTMTASDLGRGIAENKIDPRDLTETYLAAIDAHEFTNRIYARVTHARARAEAAAAHARAKSGFRKSLLDGVPISWKDLFDSAGTVTEAGSMLLEGRVPTADAVVLRNATMMGLVCLGKTHMTELAFSGLGLNPMTQTPPCVNDHAAAPGGSSSGAATSVAFNLAVAGIGSDTGGSVRVPAAWNDTVGFKTTSGVLSLEGVVPLCAKFDTVGPLTRSVEDAAHLFAAMSGTAAPDLTGVQPRGLRLANLLTVAQEQLDPTVQQAYEGALNDLRRAGVEVIDFEFAPLAEAMSLSPTLFAPEAYGTWKEVIEANPTAMYPEILERFRGGKTVNAADYVAAWQKLENIRIQWAQAAAQFDGVLLPSTPNTPPNVARLASDSDYFKSANLLTLRNTRIGNLMGLCGSTLPTQIPSCGLMVLGAANAERHLLRVSSAIEMIVK